MPPKSSNDNSASKNKIKLELEKLKNDQFQHVKVDLAKVNIRTLATQVGVLSEDVRLYMYLLASKRYYALNDRTINLLMKGDIDMSVATSETAEVITDSGKEVVHLINVEQEIEFPIVGKKRTRAGVSFFPYLNITIFDLSKYGIFKIVDRRNYKHTCLYLALQSGGLSDIKLQELILSLRNRHVHKCDLENVCNTLEIHIEIIPLRSNGENRVEHYGNDFDETCNLGLVKIHYFINYYTELTSYSLEHYEEANDIKDCNKIYKKFNDKYKKGNDRFIKAFQVFKILIDTVDKLSIPMELTDEVLNTQFYDKGEEYKTLQYNIQNCRLEEYVETDKTI